MAPGSLGALGHSHAGQVMSRPCPCQRLEECEPRDAGLPPVLFISPLIKHQPTLRAQILENVVSISKNTAMTHNPFQLGVNILGCPAWPCMSFTAQRGWESGQRQPVVHLPGWAWRSGGWLFSVSRKMPHGFFDLVRFFQTVSSCKAHTREAVCKCRGPCAHCCWSLTFFISGWASAWVDAPQCAHPSPTVRHCKASRYPFRWLLCPLHTGVSTFLAVARADAWTRDCRCQASMLGQLLGPWGHSAGIYGAGRQAGHSGRVS